MSSLQVVVSHPKSETATSVTEKVQNLVLKSDLGKTPKDIQDALILAAKIVGRELNPDVLNLNQLVARDIKPVKPCPTTSCALACLYSSLLTAIVLLQQVRMDGVL